MVAGNLAALLSDFQTFKLLPVPKISVVIITLNEADNIGRCLRAAQPVADELLLADSGSKDGTLKIAEELGARVVQVEWQGYAKTKNYANSLAANDWILSLDADEVLSETLQASILKLKQEADLPATYSFNRLTNYCGKWIRSCGWFPDWKPRLFHRERARWVGAFVHETLESDPEVEVIQLEGLCYHYSISSLEQHLRTVDKFSSLKAQELYAKGEHANFIKLWIKPWAEFLKSYFLKGGIRDGYYGYTISRMNAYSKFLRYAKLQLLWEQTQGGGPGVNTATPAQSSSLADNQADG